MTNEARTKRRAKKRARRAKKRALPLVAIEPLRRLFPRVEVTLPTGPIGGRPTEWSLELQQRILHWILEGNTWANACVMAGIGTTVTPDSWMRAGRAESAKPEPDVKNFRYQFFVAVTRARRIAEARHVANITRAAPMDWRASGWWLTHGPFRRDWSEHTVQEVRVGELTAEADAGRVDRWLDEIPDRIVEVEATRFSAVLAELPPPPPPPPPRPRRVAFVAEGLH